MEKLKLNAIFAISKNLCIGGNNRLLWNIPEDLDFFKSITLGHTVVMGRNTFASIGYKPLHKRLNIVVSKTYRMNGDDTKNLRIIRDINGDVNKLCDLAMGDVFIIGGKSLYEKFIYLCSVVYITWVDKVVDGGDTFIDDVVIDYVKTEYEEHEISKIFSSTENCWVRFCKYTKKIET
jgi:dihydrofolate reductase